MLTKKNKYILGSIIAISILIVNQITIQYFLHQKHQDSKTINVAGRQRMLSQKLNLQYLELLNNDTVNNTIKKTYNNWQQVHNALIYGNNVLNIKGVKNVEIVQELSELTNKIKIAGKIIHQKPTFIKLKFLKQNQAQFLNIMDGVVNKLETEANKKLNFIIILEILLCLLSIIIITLEIFLIYKPIFKQQKITNKKTESSESKLNAILNSTTDTNIFISPDFKVINFNNAAQQSIKVFYGKEIVFDQDFREFIIPGTEDIFYKEFANCLKGEIISSEYNFNKHGFDIWFCNTYYPVYNNLKQLIGVTFNSANIDKRKKAEIKIEAQVQQLKQIAWEQSHLIRSPLANILGLTNLMVDYKKSQTAEENEIYCNLLHEVKRLDVIVNDIIKKTANT